MNHSSIRILSVSSSLFFGVACLQPLSAATAGDFTYDDTGSSITISGAHYNAAGDLSIPSTIDGKPVTAIAERAFLANRQIKSLSIPPSVTNIGPTAFAFCRSLTKLNIPAGVSVIEENTFYNCTVLNNITLPENLTVLGQGAFGGCRSLTAATIPTKVTTLGLGAYEGTGLAKIVIPANVKSIGLGAFHGCQNLRVVEINADLTEIDVATFAECTQLTRIRLPDSVRKIGESAFQRCAFAKFDLNGANEIGPDVFRYCGRLTSVTFPKTVKRIGSRAFRDCGQLASVVFEGDAPKMGTGVFNRSAPDFGIFVSDESDRFTIPRWQGYVVSRPRGEITVQLANRNHVLNSAHLTKFGMVLEGTTSRPNVFTIRNVGTRELSGLSARINGGDWSDFLIKVPMKRSLAPGKTTTVAIVFKPREKGKRASTLQILSSDGNESPFEIGLSGVGLQVLK